MKNILTVLLLSLSLGSFAQSEKKSDPAANIRQFWFVVLKTGPNDKKITDTAERKKIFAGYMANIVKLHEEGIIMLAGPFGKNDLTWRGLFVIDCKTKGEAEKYLQTDPSISSGIFITDIVPWYTDPSVFAEKKKD